MHRNKELGPQRNLEEKLNNHNEIKCMSYELILLIWEILERPHTSKKKPCAHIEAAFSSPWIPCRCGEKFSVLLLLSL